MENIEVGMVVRVSGQGVGEVVEVNPHVDEIIVKMSDEVNVISFTEKRFNRVCSNIDFDEEGWI